MLEDSFTQPGWGYVKERYREKDTAVRQKGERRVEVRLSNYPFKPNLRCCLKLTYANEVTKSHRGPQ